MTKRPDIPVFLPSGCLSLESIQKYMNGGFSNNERADIARHLKECRFCNEAYEGFLLIPDPFEQKAAIRSMREGIFRNMRNRGKDRERRLWPGKRINVAAIAAGIVLLTGVFSVYTFLLKKNRSYIAEENISRKESLLKEKEPIAFNRLPENTYDTNIILSEPESEVAVTKSMKSIPEKKGMEMPESEKDEAVSNKIVIADKDNSNPKEYNRSVLGIAKEEPALETQAVPVPEINLTETPRFKSKNEMPAGAELSVKQTSADLQKDSTKPPKFISDDYTGFNDYVLKNLNKLHPELKIPTEGKVTISFVVTREGVVESVRILKGSGTEIEKAILQLIQKSPNWVPASKKGQKTDYQMQFTLSLTDDSSN